MATDGALAAEVVALRAELDRKSNELVDARSDAAAHKAKLREFQREVSEDQLALLARLEPWRKACSEVGVSLDPEELIQYHRLDGLRAEQPELAEALKSLAAVTKQRDELARIEKANRDHSLYVQDGLRRTAGHVHPMTVVNAVKRQFTHARNPDVDQALLRVLEGTFVSSESGLELARSMIGFTWRAPAGVSGEESGLVYAGSRLKGRKVEEVSLDAVEPDQPGPE